MIVDPDRVCPLRSPASASRRLPGGDLKSPKSSGSVEIAQFPARHLDQIGRKALRSLAVEDGFSGPVAEVSDHQIDVSLNDTGVQTAVRVRIASMNRPDRTAAAEKRTLSRAAACSGEMARPTRFEACVLCLRRVALYPAELRVPALLTQCLRGFLTTMKKSASIF